MQGNRFDVPPPTRGKLYHFEKFEYGLQRAVSQYLMDTTVNTEAVQDHLRHEIVVTVRGFVWGQPLTPKTVAHYPADWWQAFKERWFPDWLIKRYPIRYTDVVVSAKVLYPDLRDMAPAGYRQLVKMDDPFSYDYDWDGGSGWTIPRDR